MPAGRSRKTRGSASHSGRSRPARPKRAIVEDSTLQRKPIPGFEGFYEVTRRGDVYSKRLHRFIRQQERLEHNAAIEFTINGKRHRLPLAPTVADAFLSPAERMQLVSDMPNLHKLTPEQLQRDAAVDSLAERYNVAREAVLAVLRRARAA